MTHEILLSFYAKEPIILFVKLLLYYVIYCELLRLIIILVIIF